MTATLPNSETRTPEVSVVMATRNAASTLRRALASVERLEAASVELVVMDCCSTDDTLALVQACAVKRKVVVSEPDGGIYDALNKGVRRASGEWIYVLGADDELTPDGMAALLAEAGEADCVYGDVMLRFDTGVVRRYASKPASILPRTMCCSHQALLMRRSAMLAMGGFDTQFPVSADYDLLLGAYMRGLRFRQTHVVVAYFACQGESSHLSWQVPVEQYKIYKKNKANTMPLLIVAWNLAKRIARMVYDPKPKVG